MWFDPRDNLFGQPWWVWVGVAFITWGVIALFHPPDWMRRKSPPMTEEDFQTWLDERADRIDPDE